MGTRSQTRSIGNLKPKSLLYPIDFHRHIYIYGIKKKTGADTSMVEYRLVLKIQNTNEEYSYSLPLTPAQEDNPEIFFASAEIRENMRNQLQKQSSYIINDNHLNQMIKTWIQDIKEGYRDSRSSLHLTLHLMQSIQSISDKGNQEISALIYPDLSEIEPSVGMLPPLNFS